MIRLKPDRETIRDQIMTTLMVLSSCANAPTVNVALIAVTVTIANDPTAATTRPKRMALTTTRTFASTTINGLVLGDCASKAQLQQKTSPISQSAPSAQCSSTRAKLLRLYASKIGPTRNTPEAVLLHQRIQITQAASVAESLSPPKYIPIKPKVGASVMPTAAARINNGTSFARAKFESNPPRSMIHAARNAPPASPAPTPIASIGVWCSRSSIATPARK